MAGEQNQTAPIDVVVTNTGEVPLVNVRLIEKYPPSITPQPTDQGAEVISGQVQRLIERLEVGAKKVFRVNCVLRQATRATIFVDGSAETDPPGAKVYFGLKEDGEVCTTPCTVDAPVGETPIIVEAENRRPVIENLIVTKKSGRPQKVRYKLEPAIGAVSATISSGSSKLPSVHAMLGEL